MHGCKQNELTSKTHHPILEDIMNIASSSKGEATSTGHEITN
jgi:hypothetical protein